jgi:hypothetical protein
MRMSGAAGCKMVWLELSALAGIEMIDCLDGAALARSAPLFSRGLASGGASKGPIAGSSSLK